MALQVCKECSTRYAPAAACPQCGAAEWLGELEADGPAEAAPAPRKPAVPPVRLPDPPDVPAGDA